MQLPIRDEQVEPPLCVDLDGTLVRTDTLHESLLALARSNPAALPATVWTLAEGKAQFKRRVAETVKLDVAALPYHQPFLDFLRLQAAAGRRLILVTAADESIARDVARHLKLFPEVLGSSPGRNLKGDAKRRALVEAFGERGFDYAGNSTADLHVWSSARRAIVVSTSGSFIASVRRKHEVEREFLSPGISARAVLRAIRVKQWVKNILVFVPAVAAHEMLAPAVAIPSLLAFLCFCLTASSGYLINDLMDMAADRFHHEKQHRPFASGVLPPWIGVVLLAVFMAAALAVAGLALSRLFFAALLAYFAITLAYSLVLKKHLLLDVIVLAGLYSLRVFAGGAATGVFLSPWLVAFTIFFFLSLALVKRVSELQGLRNSGQSLTRRRAYVTEDIQPLSVMGITSGYISCFILALYMNSPEVSRQYQNPRWLWMICPAVLYWISRVWLKGHRGEVNEDPILYAARDKASYVVFAVGAIVFALAI